MAQLGGGSIRFVVVSNRLAKVKETKPRAIDPVLMLECSPRLLCVPAIGNRAVAMPSAFAFS